MNKPWVSILMAVVLFVIGIAFFCSGITWGLPSRLADPFLFGDLPPWSGQEILRLAGQRPDDSQRGADVDADALQDRNHAILLNETDEQRAAIVRRFRLYSYQPDEMITLMALASMRPSEGRLDPKLYQYGGLWIYPVGGLIKIASILGIVRLKTDLAYYLEYPDEFGRFYVVARLYTVFWALVGVWVVFWLTRRLAGGCRLTAMAAAACYAVMPIVVNMSHEAKPHLPAAVLMLLAVAAAVRYVDTGSPRWWLGTAALCGSAFGMVLSALPIFVIIPVMMVLRRRSWLDWLTKSILGGLMGLAVYLVANPYIVINAFYNREVLRSNFGNSLAMYEIARLGKGFMNTAWLVGEGASNILAVAGIVCVPVMVVMAWRHRADAALQGSEKRCSSAVGWLLSVPVLLILIQFVALAAGKPGEYGRFAILPDIALGMAAVVGVSRLLKSAGPQIVCMALLILITAVPGYGYLRGFMLDTTYETSRVRTAIALEEQKTFATGRLAVLAEPAPYIMPPVDLFRWRLILWPCQEKNKIEMLSADLLIRAGGKPPFSMKTVPMGYSPVTHQEKSEPTPISWANKGFELMVAKEPPRSPGKPVNEVGQ